MTGIGQTIWTNVRWEWIRLRRSQRVFLLLIPPVAGPVGSGIADVYLRIPSVATALVLGLLIEAGLAALVILDLTALAAGEDLVRRVHLVTFPLPQSRSAMLAGRLLVAIGGSLLAFSVGAAGVWFLGGALVQPQPFAAAPLFDPLHLLLALPALLVFLAGVTAAGAVITRGASEALVAGILAGVLVAGGAGYLVAQHGIHWWFPALLLVAGLGALGWAIYQYARLEA